MAILPPCPVLQVSVLRGIFNAKPLWDHTPQATTHTPAPPLVVKSPVLPPNLAPTSATPCNKISSTEHLVKVVANVPTVIAKVHQSAKKSLPGFRNIGIS